MFCSKSLQMRTMIGNPCHQLQHWYNFSSLHMRWSVVCLLLVRVLFRWGSVECSVLWKCCIVLSSHKCRKSRQQWPSQLQLYLFDLEVDCRPTMVLLLHMMLTLAGRVMMTMISLLTNLLYLLRIARRRLVALRVSKDAIYIYKYCGVDL